MSTQVDDLQIKLEGEAKGAEGALDRLIKRVGELGQEVSNFGNKTSGSISKSFTNVNFGNVKDKAEKLKDYTDKIASDMAKNLILEFEIKDDNAKSRVKELSQMLLKQRMEASKLSEETGVRSSFDAEDVGKRLEAVIVGAHNVKDAAKEAELEWKNFYDMLRTYSGKINVGDDGLKEMRHVLGEWKHLDGLIKSKFSSKEGMSISSLFDDFDSALGGQLQRLADGMDNSFDNKEKKIKAVVEALRLYREELKFIPKASADSVATGVWDVLIEKLGEVDRVSRQTFENVDSRIAKIKQRVGDTGKDYATRGSGASLQREFQVQDKIESLQEKINNLKDKASLNEVGTTGWIKIQAEIAITENKIESLKGKLEEVRAAARKAVEQATFTDNSGKPFSIEEGVKSALETIELLNKNTFKTDEGLKGILEQLKELKAAIDEDGNAFEQAFGNDTSIIETLNKAIEDTQTRIKNLSKSVTTAGSASQSTGTAIEANAEEVSASVEEEAHELSNLGNVIEFVRRRFENLPPNPFEQFGATKPTQEYIELQRQIDDTTYRLDKYKRELEELGQVGHGNVEEQERFKRLQLHIEEAEQSLEQLYGELDEMGSHTHEINWQGFGQLLSTSFNDAKNAVKTLLNYLKSLYKTLTNKVSAGLKTISDQISKLDVASKALTKSFTKISNMLRLMVTRMILRGVINEVKTSFEELVQFSDKVANAYNKIRNALKYLADSLAALVSPLLISGVNFRNLGDIVDGVADKIVGFINKINQLLAALTGKSTWIMAEKQQKDYAASLDKSSKSAKKLNKQLAAFDELNNLTTHENSGTNKDTGTGGKQFKEMPIDPKWIKIAKWLKDMWKKADFTELGRFLGEKLRDALNSIPWGKIQNAARRLAKSLATLLNGFFSTPGLAKAIGNSIAQAINTGLIFAEEFVKDFDFAAFGKFIGDAIVHVIKNIHWQRFIDACKGLGEGLAKAINSLVDTGVVAEIGKAIGKLLVGAIGFAFNLVTKINFKKLGQEIVKGIKKFFDEMDQVDESGLNGWQKLGKTISDAITGILQAINAVLTDTNVRDSAKKAFKEFFEQIDFKTIVSESKTMIQSLIDALKYVIETALGDPDFMSAATSALKFFLDKFGIIFGAMLVKNALKIITTGFLFKLGQMLAPVAGNVLKFILGGISNLFTSVGAFLLESLPAIIHFLGLFLEYIAAPIAAAIGGLEIGKKLGEAIFPDDKELYEKYKGIKGSFELLKETVVTFAEEFRDNVPEAAKLMAERTGEHLSNLGHKIFDNLYEWSLNINQKTLVPLDQKITAFCENVKNSFTNMVQNVKDKFENVRSAITKVFDDIGQFFENLPKKAMTWGGNFVTGLINGMKEKFPRLTNLATSIVTHFRQNAGGGIFVNGQWKPIQGYAGGGQPKSAEMFLARENGAPELVGKMGSHTAVANNDQIVASVADGVYRAVVSAMAASSNSSKVQIELIPDKDNLFKVIQKEGNDFQKRTGNPVWA